MKTLILVILLSGNLYAMGNRKAPLVEANLLKAQAEEMNLLKSEVKGDMSAIKGKIEKMEVDLKANASAVVGVGNRLNQVNTSAGRDNIVQNDTRIFELQTKLSEANIKIWKAVCLALISLLVSCVTLLGTIFKLLMSFFTKYMFYKEQTYMRINTDDERAKLKDLQKKK